MQELSHPCVFVLLILRGYGLIRRRQRKKFKVVMLFSIAVDKELAVRFIDFTDVVRSRLHSIRLIIFFFLPSTQEGRVIILMHMFVSHCVCVHIFSRGGQIYMTIFLIGRVFYPEDI